MKRVDDMWVYDDANSASLSPVSILEQILPFLSARQSSREQHVGMRESRVFAAFLRTLLAYTSGRGRESHVE